MQQPSWRDEDDGDDGDEEDDDDDVDDGEDKDDDDDNDDDDDDFNGNKSAPAEVEAKLVMMKISVKVANVRRESYLL